MNASDPNNSNLFPSPILNLCFPSTFLNLIIAIRAQTEYFHPPKPDLYRSFDECTRCFED
ncbi:hypothetical protein IE53DRAFT_385778 [Violaceomyces palustris]|uniref:Uncharacterized protein n=1 Tax=Violaceomyces palustris TaxID=1673888 RepID=A0ACD0P1F5_9BASI|nr:hypothetical protein IE53DRAFT_385778 [Violaceomyces palustris]